MKNYKLSRLLLLQKFLKAVENNRKILFKELVDNVYDDVIFKRRFRMLQQLSKFESQIIEKIFQFETNDSTDFDFFIEFELGMVTNRSA